MKYNNSKLEFKVKKPMHNQRREKFILPSSH